MPIFGATTEAQVSWPTPSETRGARISPPGDQRTGPGTAEQLLIGTSPSGRPNRAAFEQVVFEQLGQNPFRYDPYRDVERITAETLPRLFERVFQGRVMWSDRNRLTKRQWDAWNEAVKMYRADITRKAKRYKAALKEEYNWLMNQFDNQVKEREAAMERVEAFSKPPDMKKMVNADGEFTWHRWDPSKREFIDTGKGVEPEKPAEEEGMPSHVREAVNFIKKFGTPNPSQTAIAMVAANPEAINNPGIRKQFEPDVPDELRPVYDKMVRTVDDYYKRAQVGAEVGTGAQADIGAGEGADTGIGAGTGARAGAEVGTGARAGAEGPKTGKGAAQRKPVAWARVKKGPHKGKTVLKFDDGTVELLE